MKLFISQNLIELAIVSGIKKLDNTTIGGESIEEIEVGSTLCFKCNGKQLTFKVTQLNDEEALIAVSLEGVEEAYLRCILIGSTKYDIVVNNRKYVFELNLTPSPKIRAKLDESFCISHPTNRAKYYCDGCGEPICDSCYYTNQMYSMAAEGAIHLCKRCYEGSVRYYQNKR